jgi:hypothetical protein
MFRGKILGKWVNPTSEWITRYCYPWNVSKIQNHPSSVLMACDNCGKETFNKITEAQENGKETIQCPICKEYNLL